MDSYPITVTVLFNGHVLWKGSQRNLFKKYAQNRAQSQKEIVAAVSTLLDTAKVEALSSTKPEVQETAPDKNKTEGCNGDLCERDGGDENRWFC